DRTAQRFGCSGLQSAGDRTSNCCSTSRRATGDREDTSDFPAESKMVVSSSKSEASRALSISVRIRTVALDEETFSVVRYVPQCATCAIVDVFVSQAWRYIPDPLYQRQFG